MWRGRWRCLLDKSPRPPASPLRSVLQFELAFVIGIKQGVEKISSLRAFLSEAISLKLADRLQKRHLSVKRYALWLLFIWVDSNLKTPLILLAHLDGDLKKFFDHFDIGFGV